MLINKLDDYNTVNLSKSTCEIYRRVFKNFSKIVGNKILNEITNDDIEYYKSIRSNEVKRTTVNIEIRTLKSIFRFALRNNFLITNPASETKQFIISEKQKRIFSKDDLEKLFGVMNNLFRNIFLVLIYTGCRLNEVLNLEFKNIDFSERTLEIVNKANFKTKTGKIRTIPINEELLNVFKTLIQNQIDFQRYVFPNPIGNPLNKSYVSRKFKGYLRLAGLNENLHLHCLRHTFITELIRNNVEISKVMKIAGHTSIQTTLGYTHLFVEDFRKDMDNLKFLKAKPKH